VDHLVEVFFLDVVDLIIANNHHGHPLTAETSPGREH
jgi:hypothetical protein